MVYCTDTSVHFFSFHFFFWGFSVYKMQICFGFKNIFFFQILNFSRYLPKHPQNTQNDPKFFQSGIGTPWTKFLESPLTMPLILKLLRDVFVSQDILNWASNLSRILFICPPPYVGKAVLLVLVTYILC